MRIEVEQKYRVDSHDKIRTNLKELGVPAESPEVQTDTYYGHPQRDFATTDEALRIRQVGPLNWLTYKGKKLDQTTKSRHEIDLSIADGEQGALAGSDMLVALGFRPVAEVRKVRQNFHLERGKWIVELSLDEINGLGTFVELEIVTDESHLENAKVTLGQVANELDLDQIERSSYLELLLQSMTT